MCALPKSLLFWGHEITPETLTLASKCFFWGYSAARGGRFGESFLASFVFPHVNQAESAKEFELNNLITQISRDCGLKGLPWQRLDGLGIGIRPTATLNTTATYSLLYRSIIPLVSKPQ